MGGIGRIPGQLGQGVLHGEGIAGGAAHAINPTLGKIYDVGNALAGASLGIPPGALGTSNMGAKPAAPTVQMPQLTATPSSPMAGMNPQILRLIQMLAQQGIPGAPTV